MTPMSLTPFIKIRLAELFAKAIAAEYEDATVAYVQGMIAGLDRAVARIDALKREMVYGACQ